MSSEDGAGGRDLDQGGAPGGPLAAAAAERLAALEALPPEEHVGLYDELHSRLQGALAATSGEPASAPRGAPVPSAPRRGA